MKSSGALIGVGCCCVVVRLGTVCFGRSWLKMSANLAKAMLVSVPNAENGDDGAGCWRM